MKRGIISTALVLIALIVVGCVYVMSPPIGAKVVNEADERLVLGRRVRQLLEKRLYDDLEAASDSLCRAHAQFPSGASKIFSFYNDGFGSIDSRGPEAWKKHFQRITEWRVRRPESVPARIAEAEALIGHGWSVRGHGFAWTVSESHARQFENDMWKAVECLSQCADSARAYPAWYDASLIALHSIGSETDSSYRFTFHEAIARFPGESRFYLSMSNHLLPIWYGKSGEWERFAETCTQGLPDSIANEIYARIVLSREKNLGNVFDDCPSITWRKVRHGLEAWDRRCPASIQPASAIALLAFEAKQRFAARRAFDRLQNQLELDVWRHPVFYRLARVWAFLDA